MQENTQDIQKKFKEADERMHQLERDIEFFENFLSRYANAIENIRQLEDFYQQPFIFG